MRLFWQSENKPTEVDEGVALIERPAFPFEIGDVVCLRSETKRMTVAGFNWNKENSKWEVGCDWLNTEMNHVRVPFWAAQLVVVTSEVIADQPGEYVPPENGA